jgi:phenylacetic acid degradation operon negative regulatory protein
MLFGVAAFRRPAALAAGSVLDVLGGLGVSEHAARSTLARMADRNLICRYRRGRETYFGLTSRGSSMLAEGQAVARQSPDRNWDGTWTIVGFSLPEEYRGVRHQVRSRLAWRGFGLLRSGMWIAPGHVDVLPLFEDLPATPALHVFSGASAAAPAGDAEIIPEAWDLQAIASRYTGFASRWNGPVPAGDPLGALLHLQSEWAQVARSDPRLPLSLLPEGWPSLGAFELYLRLDDEVRPPAERACTERVRTLSLTDVTGTASPRSASPVSGTGSAAGSPDRGGRWDT